MKHSLLAGTLGAVALLAGGAMLAVAYLSGGDRENEPVPTSGEVPTDPPATPATDPWVGLPKAVSSKQPLWDIRLDAARALAAEPLAVRLTEIRRTTFDGCIGVRPRGGACTAIARPGYLAVFDVNGKKVTYHVAGYQWLGPVDGLNAEVDDGTPTGVDRSVDLNGILADYVRRELALTKHEEPSAVTVIHIVPTTFFNRCLGYSLPPTGTTAPCDLDIGERFPGAFVQLLVGGARYNYNVSTAGTTWLDYSRGTGLQQPSMNVGEIQQLMREDLAGRRGAPIADVSIVSYRDVTWRDGCLGARKPGDVCAATAVRGFLARLRVNGEDEEYHGAGTAFVDAWVGGLELGAPTFDP